MCGAGGGQQLSKKSRFSCEGRYITILNSVNDATSSRFNLRMRCDIWGWSAVFLQWKWAQQPPPPSTQHKWFMTVWTHSCWLHKCWVTLIDLQPPKTGDLLKSFCIITQWKPQSVHLLKTNEHGNYCYYSHSFRLDFRVLWSQQVPVNTSLSGLGPD